MVIEMPADQAVPWMAPIDAGEAQVMAIGPRSKLEHSGGMNAAYVDGSVRFLKANASVARRQSAISDRGGR